MSDWIIQLARKKLLDNEELITFDEAHKLALLGEEYLFDLISLSYKVTAKYKNKGIYLCSIISAKTGACPENCTFCAQSAHNQAPVSAHQMIDPSLILSHTDLSVGCSLGILIEEQARRLSASGVRRYNHNLETSRSFFPNVCTTHTYEERVKTAYLVKESGMELCCGGVLGMGESLEQRLELAFELRALNPTLVPLNFLNPRPGTDMANRSLLTPIEAIKSIALFRLILPQSILICAGGREVVLRDLQPLALLAGANALITGNYLTTPGRLAKEDLQMISDLNMPVAKYTAFD